MWFRSGGLFSAKLLLSSFWLALGAREAKVWSVPAMFTGVDRMAPFEGPRPKSSSAQTVPRSRPSNAPNDVYDSPNSASTARRLKERSASSRPGPQGSAGSEANGSETVPTAATAAASVPSSETPPSRRPGSGRRGGSPSSQRPGSPQRPRPTSPTFMERTRTNKLTPAFRGATNTGNFKDNVQTFKASRRRSNWGHQHIHIPHPLSPTHPRSTPGVQAVRTVTSSPPRNAARRAESPPKHLVRSVTSPPPSKSKGKKA